ASSSSIIFLSNVLPTNEIYTLSLHDALPISVFHGTRPGWIEVITGVMFSGKSEELVRRVRRAVIAKKRVQVFKSHLDARYAGLRSEEHTSELQSRFDLVCRLLLEKKKITDEIIFDFAKERLRKVRQLLLSHARNSAQLS